MILMRWVWPGENDREWKGYCAEDNLIPCSFRCVINVPNMANRTESLSFPPKCRVVSNIHLRYASLRLTLRARRPNLFLALLL